MKYQTEYQRNYQNRTPKRFHELSPEERKLSEVPKRSSSSPSRRRRSLPASPNRNYNDNDDIVVIGPNEKFSTSAHYRLRHPVKGHHRVAKSQEYVVLGRNQKFEDNVIYPLRNPVITNSPRVVVRQRPNENHSCGIQTEIDQAPSNSYVAQYRQNAGSNKKRTVGRSEYKQKYNWKHPTHELVNKQKYNENSELRDRRLELMEPSAHFHRPEQVSLGVNTSKRLEDGVHANRQQVKRCILNSTKPFRPSNDKTIEHRINDTRNVNPKQRKAHEAEEVQDRKRKEYVEIDHAHTDDEDIGRNIDLGNEFRQKYPHGKLRRCQSEYQSTYKPFWRFDYKNGKWYKDTSVEETGFNPNLFWYKELMSTRKQAGEYRSNAEKDHLYRDNILPSGFDSNNYYRGCNVNANESDTNSVISIDRDLEREHIEGECRREKDAKRKANKPIHYIKPKQIEKALILKTDQTIQTDHPNDRVIYIDEIPAKEPGVATRAFVRNLSSSSIQQHMSWESDSLYSRETNSDICLDETKYTNYRLADKNKRIRKRLPKQQESRGTTIHSPLSAGLKQNNLNNDCISPQALQRISQYKEPNRFANYSVASNQESHNATGRPSYDAPLFDRRPYSSMNEYCSYPGSRFKDEVTEYYYGRDDNRQQNQHTPVSKSAFQNHLQRPNENFGQTYYRRHKDDDVLSVNSARSLTSSCSLASQTLERAQNNMNKYWGEPARTSNCSPKKPYRGEN
ncbi:unnamed protein product [Rotaria magnacalcarata]|uniref:Nuclear protein MDM1 n=1 Tax=Rotaria magnacalcarata TaxID=392030 RepID=A0A816V6N6_9BILA|nr:unnamed protein product [Rotaria magnacalcarata]CAF2134864.1 unnamed protein product [Rotaria magnacalcarata]CAF3924123.1 unnamed protein product [Rotaria magnacalcarata]CAF4035417.1 unnamed protein product [Rotaria magnacalcarata]